MPTNTNDSSLLNSFHQVPAKTLGEFNITYDKIYTLTLSDDNDLLVDINFGKLAALSAVPPASENEVGGVRLYSNSDLLGEVINEANKLYPVLLTSVNDKPNIAFVHVPWKNTTYIPDDRPDDGNTLSIQWQNEEDTLHGGQYYIGIKFVPARLLSGIGDMVVDDPSKGRQNYALLSCVSAVITEPLDRKILDAIQIASDDLTAHNALNMTDLSIVNTNISCISVNLSSNYYKKSETSANWQLRSLFVGLSNDFVKYLNNTLFQNIHTNPSYLSTETSSATLLNDMFNSLSNTICADYMYKYESYLCSETSSKIELANKFNTKQDNLTVNGNIADGVSYGNKDIATVNAISAFVQERLELYDAVFHGYFNSLAEVPNNATDYPLGLPNKNDYIYVNVTANDINTPGFNFKKASNPLGVWRMKIASYEWDASLQKSNWKPEYKLSETAFTSALIAAMNSGITAKLVSYIMSYPVLSNMLTNLFPNMTTKFGKLAMLDKIDNNITGAGNVGQLAAFNGVNNVTGINFAPTREKWIFELQDGLTHVAKYILTQPA